jgi:isocitrate dehydrogenase
MQTNTPENLITFEDSELKVPNNPEIPFIIGDGIGPDIWSAASRVIDEAVNNAYKGEKQIIWKEVLAGEKAYNITGEWLPDETVASFKHHIVGIKGPLTTPVGGGIRSINVALRQILDLFACVRPVRWYEGIPSPVKKPEDVNMVIFRENTEDVYAGYEFKQGEENTAEILKYFKDNLGWDIASDSGLGIKPISIKKTYRLVRAAINYAIANGRKTVTLVHKGNIMKFTEGAFREWGYEVAKNEFSDKVVSWDDCGGKPGDKILIEDVIADNAFQQVLINPSAFDVLATTNLNGDYLSDALAAQVGGLGIAPGANINYETGAAIFEATHGTAPKYAGENVANPGSILLSGVMMLEYLGWKEAAEMIESAYEKTIDQKILTQDFARQLDGVTHVGTQEFADAVITNL